MLIWINETLKIIIQGKSKILIVFNDIIADMIINKKLN